LPIEVTLLFQSKSEEIERISSVQHYKRKAVESKVTIQPFVTEEEAGNQRTRKLIRNDEGSNGSYKGGAYRDNRNNNNSLQGNIAELGNNIYQYGTLDQRTLTLTLMHPVLKGMVFTLRRYLIRIQ
jgi:hypothetical protein